MTSRASTSCSAPGVGCSGVLGDLRHDLDHADEKCPMIAKWQDIFGYASFGEVKPIVGIGALVVVTRDYNGEIIEFLNNAVRSGASNVARADRKVTGSGGKRIRAHRSVKVVLQSRDRLTATHRTPTDATVLR